MVDVVLMNYKPWGGMRMKEVVENIINEVREYEGMPADKVTHGLKIYNGKEYNSMIAGVTARMTDMQEVLNIREVKIKNLEKILLAGGVFSVIGISTMLVGIHFLKKEQEKLKETIEKFTALEGKEIESIECSRCENQALNVDENSILFGDKN